MTINTIPKDQDVLMYYYVSHDLECQDFESDWEYLVEHYSLEEKILLVKYDLQNNDSQYIPIPQLP